MAKSRIIVEIEDLISTVRAKACLWDQTDPNYFKRDYQRVAWIEVSDELKAPVIELKKRWRGLRDTFTRELRKLDITKTDEELAGHATWRHFSTLLFLRNVVSAPRKPRKRRADTKQEYEVELIDNEDGTNISISDSSSSPETGAVDTEDPLTSIIFQAFKHEGESITGDMTEVPVTNGEKAGGVTSGWDNDWKENMMDADAQFLMSLLPFLQDVPRNRKLLVRAKLTQVLMDEQNAQNYS